MSNNDSSPLQHSDNTNDPAPCLDRLFVPSSSSYPTDSLDDPNARERGNIKWTRYIEGEMTDASLLDEAIEATQHALDSEVNSKNDARLLVDLGLRLVTRYIVNTNVVDLSRAISMFERVLELSCDEDSDLADLLDQLGVCLGSLFDREGELLGLHCSVLIGRCAVGFTPFDHAYKPIHLHNLGISFLRRFERTGALDDIEQAIAAHCRALELTPDGHANKPALYSNIGNSFLSRFERTGELDDIEQAIAAHRRALELTPDGHADKPRLFSNLGYSFSSRFERAGELDDIEQAIAALRRALELTPDGHADKPGQFSNLGNSILSRFERTGELDDIEQAIAAHRRALELTPDGHVGKSRRLSNLGNSFSSRFERTGELDDIEQAITAHRRALELTPDGHADKPGQFSNLGSSILSRFERTGELDDIEQAIAAHRRALELTPDGHVGKSRRLSNLGNSFASRFERTGELDDIEQAITAHRRALELMPDGHADKPALFNNLGTSFSSCFERTGELDDIEQGMAAHRRALELTPDGHADKPGRFSNLGVSLRMLCSYQPSKSVFDEIIEVSIACITCPLGNPSMRLSAAVRCVRLHNEHLTFGTGVSLLLVYSSIILVLPEVVWLGHDIHRRFNESRRLGKLVNAAVFAAIAAGSLEHALEWLEAGRALIWSQMLSLRTPLDDLRTAHPKLAEALADVQQKLQQSAPASFSLDVIAFGDVPGMTVNPSADSHRKLAILHGSLLKQIRSCEGFEDFLLLKRLNRLLPPLELMSGPVVFINVDRSGCHALLLSTGGVVESTALVNLSYDRAVELRRLWIVHTTGGKLRTRSSLSMGKRKSGMNPLKCILAHIWNWIVRPVLEALDLLKVAIDGHIPHVTWCPTGPLMQLPLHAAGLYDEPYGPRVYDFVISSYTPSLSALTRGCTGAVSHNSKPDVLIVTQPATPNYAPLPGTVYEGNMLHDVLNKSGIAAPMLFNDKDATVELVKSSIKHFPWVHLACHGSQNSEDLTQSAFHLFNGPLTLSDLMATASGNAELAFLSACQTAVGDERTPEESAHLAAGMLAVGFKGVVATMWSIQDADAPIVVEAYYKKLIELRKSGSVREGSTGAAYALHEAVAKLRAEVGESNIGRWAPFVHFGV